MGKYIRCFFHKALYCCAVMLMVIMLFGMNNALAVGGFCGDNLTWDYSDGVLTIEGYGAMTAAPWFSNLDLNYNICKILLPDGLTSIYFKAFYESSVEELVIPDTVTDLGMQSLEGCSKLIKLTIPAELCDISSFGGKDLNIEEIHITQGTNGKMPDLTTNMNSHYYQRGLGYLSRNTLKKVVVEEGVKHIGDHAFHSCSKITSLELPMTLETIGTYACFACSSLNEIEFPETLKTIYGYAFSRCSSLKSLTLPAGLESLDGASFEYCGSIEGKVTVPEKVTFIGPGAFHYCYSIEELVIPDSVTYLGEQSIAGCTRLKKLTIPADLFGAYETFYDRNLTNTGIVEELHVTRGTTGIMKDLPSDSNSYLNGLGYMCKDRLKTVIFDEGVKHIGDYALYCCEKITNLSLPTTLESIGQYAFFECTSVTKVPLPKAMNRIGAYAFYNCSSITELTLPTSLEAIEEYTFYGCSSFEEIALPTDLGTIGKLAFYDCSSMKSLALPETLRSIGSDAFCGCRSIAGQISIPKQIRYLEESVFYNCSSIEELVIPDTVTSMDYFCIAGCDGLKKVTIPADLLDCPLFKDYSLPTGTEELHITKGTTGIILDSIENANPDDMLVIDYLCGFNLKTVILDEGITAIGAKAFSGRSGITNLTLPSTLESVGEYAFSGVGQWEGPLSFSENIKSIGDNAFNECYGITKIYFPGSAPSIGANSFGFVDADVYYNSTLSGWTGNKLQNYGGRLTWHDTYGGDESNYYINEDGSVTIKVVELVENQTVVIPSSIDGMIVSAISSTAFANIDTAGVSIQIPKSVVKIEQDTIPGGTRVITPKYSPAWFYGIAYNWALTDDEEVKITTFEMPADLSSLSANALSGTNVECVILPGECSLYTDALAHCPNLLTVVFRDKAGTLTNIFGEGEDGSGVLMVNAEFGEAESVMNVSF